MASHVSPSGPDSSRHASQACRPRLWRRDACHARAAMAAIEEQTLAGAVPTAIAGLHCPAIERAAPTRKVEQHNGSAVWPQRAEDPLDRVHVLLEGLGALRKRTLDARSIALHILRGFSRYARPCRWQSRAPPGRARWYTRRWRCAACTENPQGTSEPTMPTSHRKPPCEPTGRATAAAF